MIFFFCISIEKDIIRNIAAVKAVPEANDIVSFISEGIPKNVPRLRVIVSLVSLPNNNINFVITWICVVFRGCGSNLALGGIWLISILYVSRWTLFVLSRSILWCTLEILDNIRWLMSYVRWFYYFVRMTVDSSVRFIVILAAWHRNSVLILWFCLYDTRFFCPLDLSF